MVKRFIDISRDGFRNYKLHEHLGISLFRVIAGFFFGALVGIPLGYAMGLSDWFRGWFDPIVEFMRPVPPLALIFLVLGSIIAEALRHTGAIETITRSIVRVVGANRMPLALMLSGFVLGLKIGF